nr:sensor histidine kinase [Propionibacterium sp.]
MGRTAPPTTAPGPAAVSGGSGGIPCPPEERDRCLTRTRLAATLAERERLARELHDAPAQVLASLHLRLRGLELRPELAELAEVRAELADLAACCAEALRDLRADIRGLRDCCREDRSLPDLLDALAAGFTRGTGVPVELRVDAAAARLLSADAVAHVARIVSEALANVRKHADARRVGVRFEHRAGALVATVEDDGRGLAANPPPDAEGFGLLTMRERAELAGGVLEVGPRPGGGTRVRLTLPAEGRTTP